ncbi:MAG: hypothetical protein II539_04590 [Muribaculaceae bacterium]|nr:hypothetical protein [Muribaculaceae bacterium]
MKKITLFAFACAMLVAPAVNAQEVTYVEDPAQGYIFNNMKDNWFIQGEGGVGVMMSYKDADVKFGKRLAPKADLFIGKWFSPLLGFRIGGHFDQMIGKAGEMNAIGIRLWDTDIMKDGEKGYGQKFNRFGVTGDVLFNLTNWICGYRPGRFYNATLYAGAAVSWNVYRENKGDGDFKYAGGVKTKDGKSAHDRNFAVQAGLLNSFALSKHLDLLLDLRFDMVQDHVDGAGMGHKTWVEYPSVLLGLGYKFGKTEWNAPVVPVCPPVVDNTALINDLRNKLEGANAKIASLQKQLDDCLKRECPKPHEVNAPLATIYYPINVSKIVGVQNDVVNAVAEVMANENSNYKLTGWADNYTGNDQINVRLRKDRVAGVKKALVGKGIAENRLETTIDNANLVDYGPKCASLSRAVTIVRK